MKMLSVSKESDILFTSTPFAHVLSSKERGIRCDECFNSQPNLLRCSACKLSRYCDRNCQRTAWLLHKDECRCLVSVSPKVPTDSVRLLYRILLKLQKHGGHAEKEEALRQTRAFDKLVSHSSDIKSDEQRTEDFVQLGRTLTVFAGDTIEIPSAGDLLEIFGKMVINSFSICDGEMQPIGVGLYLGASVLDHSCQPNAVVVFCGTTACVRAIAPLPQHPDPPQVRISYLDVLSPLNDRQKELRAQYYFTCTCSVCTDPKHNSLMLAVRCPNKDCSSPVVSLEGLLPCEGCNNSDYSSTYYQQRELHIEKLSNLLPKLKELQLLGENGEILRQCKDELASSEEILHVSNTLMTRVYDQAFDACIQLTEWRKAIDYGRKTLQGYRAFYMKNHPSLGIHLMKLGKILLFVSDLREALVTLQQAESILRVTHGGDHAIYRDLTDLIVQCTEEMRSQLTSS